MQSFQISLTSIISTMNPIIFIENVYCVGTLFGFENLQGIKRELDGVKCSLLPARFLL
jgi:hypothetical protein